MQVDRSSVSITVSILVILALIGTAMRLQHSQSDRRVQEESVLVPEEDRLAAESTGSGNNRLLSVLDLTRTPAQTRSAMSFLLLMPVGLLITALAKSLIGMRTIGTFSPTLLALSQARSDWRIGVVIFAVTFGLGSLCRILLAKLRLSTVPRRGVIGTFVVLALAAAISLSHSYGLAPTARHVLLPVAVMTVMIERFFTAMEKEGNRTALTILANSIAVAVCCFAVFAYTRTGQVLLNFPELEFLIMAALVLLGRCSGRTLLGGVGSPEDGQLGQTKAE
ncbi:MAG: 7TM domain-containing protein [Planctomycetota bacterium]